VRFENLSIAEEEVLTMVLYSRADSWLGWGEARESDNVLVSLGRIFRISMHGLASTFRSLFTDKDDNDRKPNSLSIARTSVIFILAALLMGGVQNLRGQQQHLAATAKTVAKAGATAADAPLGPGHYKDTFTLNDAGSPQIELHGIDSMHSIYFTLPETHVVKTAKIHVYYAFSPSLLPQLSHLKLILNGTLFATIQPTPGQVGGSDSRDADAEFTIPTDLLVHNNTLTIEFIGHYTMVCEDPANTTLWARVHRNTVLDIQGDLLPLADDLKQLPIPFLDPALPGSFRSHSTGQCDRDCGQCRQSPRGAGPAQHQSADRGHAHQSQ
jgi:cellulose synthase (UDP-forming)